MINWFIENSGTILVLVVLLLVVIYIIVNRKKHSCSGCSSCALKDKCNKVNETQE